MSVSCTTVPTTYKSAPLNDMVCFLIKILNSIAKKILSNKIISYMTTYYACCLFVCLSGRSLPAIYLYKNYETK